METKLVKTLPTSGMTQQGGGKWSDSYGNTYVQNEYNVGKSDYGVNYTMTPKELTGGNTPNQNQGGVSTYDGSGRPVYATPDNLPSTSAGTQLTGKINNTTGATTPTPADPSTASDDEKYLMDQGFTLDQVRAKYSDPFTLREYTNLEKERQSSLEAGQSQAEASLQSSLDKIRTAKQGSLEQAKAQAGKSDPYSMANPGGGVDFGADTINVKYTQLENEVEAAHQALEANLKADNRKAAAQNLLTIQDILDKATAVKQKDEDQALQVRNQANTEAYQSSLIKNTAEDNFRANLTSLYATPEDIDNMIKDNSIYKDTTFKSGIQANYDSYVNDPIGTAQSIINTMKNGSLARQKAEQAASNQANTQAYRDQMLGIAIARLGNSTNVDFSDIPLDGKGQAFVEMAKTLSTNMSDTARSDWLKDYKGYIESGRYDLALNRIKSQVFTKMGSTEKVTIEQYDSANNAINGVINYLDTNKSASSGPWKALSESLKPWVELSRDPKYADLKSQIELAQSPIRKNLYGVAVTGSEEKNANKFLIINSDTVDIIKVKMENLKKFNEFATTNMYSKYLGLSPQTAEFYGVNTTTDSGTSTKTFSSVVDGKKFTFKTQADLDGFNKEMNIK